MKYPENINEISQMKIDFMGFIFYAPSKRDVSNFLEIEAVNSLTSSISKVGVFVNEKIEVILETVNKYSLNYIQLHGEESPEFCQSLKEKGEKIIKAFAIHSDFDFQILKRYEQVVDYFLFDTAGVLKGGNGTAFDWQILGNYSLEVPFILSGGIGLTNIESALSIEHPQLVGLDLNSQLELEPGLKSIEITQEIMNKIQVHENH